MIEELFRKDPKMKYTDMCIYIDAHMKEVTVPQENPEVEGRIYTYLCQIIAALAYKAGFFTQYEDYSEFAMELAQILYIHMRDRIINSGKVMRGKVVEPVKSVLNYIKSVLYPAKVNYQQNHFKIVLKDEYGELSAQDFKSQYMDMINEQCCHRPQMDTIIDDVVPTLRPLILKVLYKTPYKRDKVMIRKLYINCLLNLNLYLTLPDKEKIKLLEKYEKTKSLSVMLDEECRRDRQTILLWHLPSSMENYIRFLVTKLRRKIWDAINGERSSYDLSTDELDAIINSAYLENNTDRDGDY